MADAVDPRFSEFLERVKRTEMPPELFDQMKQGLTRKYQAPPVGEIEVAVRKRLNAEKVSLGGVPGSASCRRVEEDL